jgi:hypothetical protein
VESERTYGGDCSLRHARLKAIYESQQGCQPELLAYFVRVEPAYADRVFRSHPWDMQAPPSVCTVQYFERIAPLAMSAGFEQYLTAYLMHSNVYVKTTAARVLGRYGTSTALPRLWETLRYFHDWWSGKDADLAQNGEGIALEVELRNAIARARNWVVGEQELRRIEGLCVSQWCRSETQQDLAALESPLRIDLAFGPRTPGGSVAQYRGLENLAAVEAKLAQFPRATRFTLVVRGGRSSALEESLRPFAAQHGLMIQ